MDRINIHIHTQQTQNLKRRKRRRKNTQTHIVWSKKCNRLDLKDRIQRRWIFH